MTSTWLEISGYHIELKDVTEDYARGLAYTAELYATQYELTVDPSFGLYVGCREWVSKLPATDYMSLEPTNSIWVAVKSDPDQIRLGASDFHTIFTRYFVH